MTDRELDDILREGLIIINAPECLELPEEPFPTSERFERNMARLRADPKGYLRRLKRASRPLWRKVLSTAAAALVVLSLSLGAVMTVSPTARAWVQKVVVQWLEEYVGFQFRGDGAQSEGIWRPSYLPDGFQEVSKDSEDDFGRVLFISKDGKKLYFDYKLIEDGNQFSLDVEHTQYQKAEVNGQIAHLFMQTTEEWPSCLIWTDKEDFTAFRITGNVSKDELLRIAESVGLIEKNI